MKKGVKLNGRFWNGDTSAESIGMDIKRVEISNTKPVRLSVFSEHDVLQLLKILTLI